MIVYFKKEIQEYIEILNKIFLNYKMKAKLI